MCRYVFVSGNVVIADTLLITWLGYLPGLRRGWGTHPYLLQVVLHHSACHGSHVHHLDHAVLINEVRTGHADHLVALGDLVIAVVDELPAIRSRLHEVE